MIHLTVTTFNAKPVSHLAGSFDELGGTIGRAPTNQLVLPDPERVVSRVHAKVVFRGGSYALVACGGNALIHNGTMIEHGAEVRLTPGDSIEMGGYRLVVGAPESPAASDPFADMFGLEEQVSPSPQPRPRHESNSPAARPPATGSAAPAARGGVGPAIPEDWDPFGGASRIEHGMPRAQAHVAPGADPSGFPAPRAGREDSLDELFGLDSSFADEPFKKGPLAPAARPNTRGHADPLRSLQEAPPPVAGPQPDHVSDLHAPWSNLGGMKTVPGPTEGAVYSWHSQPDSTPAGKPPQPPARGKPRGEKRPREHPGGPADSPGLASHSQPAHDLLPALLEGLGVPDLPVDQLTPALMLQVGQILRESTKGTLDLLAIRTALKREIRAGVTIIKPRQNNSLKFSPSADVALRHMLGPQARGFMPPAESVRDAFQDLRAHELAVMVGMKAALAGVLERFDPVVLEGKLASSSPLAGLIPSARKARLWDLFEMLYKKLAAEAVDDFDTLFGKAFLKAYEQCLEQLSDAPARE